MELTDDAFVDLRLSVRMPVFSWRQDVAGVSCQVVTAVQYDAPCCISEVGLSFRLLKTGVVAGVSDMALTVALSRCRRK